MHTVYLGTSYTAHCAIRYCDTISEEICSNMADKFSAVTAVLHVKTENLQICTFPGSADSKSGNIQIREAQTV